MCNMIVFFTLLLTSYNLIDCVNDSNNENENLTLEFIAQQMISIDGKKTYEGGIRPAEAYETFLNYIIGTNDILYKNLNKLCNVLYAIQDELLKFQ